MMALKKLIIIPLFFLLLNIFAIKESRAEFPEGVIYVCLMVEDPSYIEQFFRGYTPQAGTALLLSNKELQMNTIPDESYFAGGAGHHFFIHSLNKAPNTRCKNGVLKILVFDGAFNEDGMYDLIGKTSWRNWAPHLNKWVMVESKTIIRSLEEDRRRCDHLVELFDQNTYSAKDRVKIKLDCSDSKLKSGRIPVTIDIKEDNYKEVIAKNTIPEAAQIKFKRSPDPKKLACMAKTERIYQKDPKFNQINSLARYINLNRNNFKERIDDLKTTWFGANVKTKNNFKHQEAAIFPINQVPGEGIALIKQQNGIDAFFEYGNMQDVSSKDYKMIEEKRTISPMDLKNNNGFTFTMDTNVEKSAAYTRKLSFECMAY
jgi:hypothetical protein